MRSADTRIAFVSAATWSAILCLSESEMQESVRSRCHASLGCKLGFESRSQSIPKSTAPGSPMMILRPE